MSELDPVSPVPSDAPSSAPTIETPAPAAASAADAPRPAAEAPAPSAVEEAAAPPPPRKSRAGTFFLGAFSGCFVVLVAGAFLAMLAALADDGTSTGELRLGSDKVAIVPVEGEILDSREAIEHINKYAASATIKAIVVRINSPGGAIAPSQEIYAAIRAARTRHEKPIVASMDSVAASGGYYIAAACDEVIANPGTITGSIGVVLQWFEMKDLVRWAKMKPETITSGPLKAAGSPYVELSDAERQYFQRIVDQLHGQFVRAIAEGRKGKISEAEVSRIADGRVFTGEEALALKLVDKLGSIDEAVRVAGKLAGIKGEPARVWPKRREPSLIDVLTSDANAKTAVEKILSRRMPQFLYRW